ncbi:MAG: hypothetical protein HY565_02220 [Candidatus Kerfeldbacteria bacterium]|nr:hypothetical protein [Candidatus Kerfeldbacteria bacterium]
MHERRLPFGRVTHNERESQRNAHELSRIFAEHHLRLNAELESALAEEAEHQEIRRGGGFLQASRMLAEYVNSPRNLSDIGLFDQDLSKNLGKRTKLVADVRPLQAAVRELQFEESQVLANIICDIAAGYEPDARDKVLFSENPDDTYAATVPNMGTCTTAETYFLEFAYDERTYKWRGGDDGYMNVIVDDKGNPLMLEKIGIGDSHSAITVQEVVLNNVRLPAGTLIGVGYSETAITKQPLRKREDWAERYVKGSASIIQASQCGSFKYLRLSSLVIGPDRRAEALKYLMQLQTEAGFPRAQEGEIEALYLDALRMLDHPDYRTEYVQRMEKINLKRIAKGWEPWEI